MDFKIDPKVNRPVQYDPEYGRFNFPETIRRLWNASLGQLGDAGLGLVDGATNKGTLAAGLGTYAGATANTLRHQRGGPSNTSKALFDAARNSRLGRALSRFSTGAGASLAKKSPTASRLATGVLKDTGTGVKALLRSLAYSNPKGLKPALKPFGTKNFKTGLAALLAAAAYQGLGNVRDVMSDRD